MKTTKTSLTHVIRLLVILTVLVGVLLSVQRLTPLQVGFDPRGLLALGFVVLACFALGELVEALRIPHITGYIVAGVFLGPSGAQLLPFSWRVPPFDKGLLTEQVSGQLAVLDALAIALISLTAGGELKISSLRTGLGTIAGVLSGQVVSMLLGITGLLWLISGSFTGIQLPGLSFPNVGSLLAFGGMCAAVSMATSPGIVIAVLNSVGSQGVFSRTVLSSVVLLDLLVVTLFSVSSAMAFKTMHLAGAAPDLGAYLLQHIGGSLGCGALVGAVISTYLRFVGAEFDLFLIALVYLVTLLAKILHLDVVILFIAAGFAASNFSRHGERLLFTLERLAIPVYVVFFTLTGARLHIDAVMSTAPFMVALVFLRLVLLKLGVSFGTRLVSGPQVVAKYGWLGFASQAGIAISLAAQLGQSFGGVGKILQTLIVAGVAVNEIFGAILLKLGISLAGEIPGQSPKTTPHLTTNFVGGGRDDLSDLGDLSRHIDGLWNISTGFSPAIDGVLSSFREGMHQATSNHLVGPLLCYTEQRRGVVVGLQSESLRLISRIKKIDQTKVSMDKLSLLTSGELSGLLLRFRDQLTLKHGFGRTLHAFDTDLFDASIQGLIHALGTQTQIELSATLGDISSSYGHPWTQLKLTCCRIGWRLTGRKRRMVNVQPLVRYHCMLMQVRMSQVTESILAADHSLLTDILGWFEHYDAEGQTRSFLDLKQIADRSSKELNDILSRYDMKVGQIQLNLQRITSETVAAVYREIGMFETPMLPATRRRPSTQFEPFKQAQKQIVLHQYELTKHWEASVAAVAYRLEWLSFHMRGSEILTQVSLNLMTRTQGAIQALSALIGLVEQSKLMFSDDKSNANSVANLMSLSDQINAAAMESGLSLRRFSQNIGPDFVLRVITEPLSRIANFMGAGYEIAQSNVRVQATDKTGMPLPKVYVGIRENILGLLETEMYAETVASCGTFSSALAECADVVEQFIDGLRIHSKNVSHYGDDSQNMTDISENSKEEWFAFIETYQVKIKNLQHNVEQELTCFERRLSEIFVEQIKQKASVVNATSLRLDVQKKQAQTKVLSHRFFRFWFTSVHETLSGILSNMTKSNPTVWWRQPRFNRELSWPSMMDAKRLSGFGKSIDSLPMGYQRLFSYHSIDGHEILGDSREWTDASLSVMDPLVSGLRSICVVGAHQEERRAVEQFIARSRAWQQVQTLAISSPNDSHILMEGLASRPRDSLIMVSGLHWLMTQEVSGGPAVEALSAAILNDHGRSGWLISMPTLAWKRAIVSSMLKHSIGLVIAPEPLGPQQLGHVILKRHLLSGMGLYVEGVVWSRENLEQFVQSGTGPHAKLLHQLIHRLWLCSAGRVHDALSVWIESISRYDEKKSLVQIDRLADPLIDILRTYPKDIALKLFHIARLGWTDETMWQNAFSSSLQEAQGDLAKLVELSLIEKIENNGQFYQISSRLSGLIEQWFSEYNWHGPRVIQ